MKIKSQKIENKNTIIPHTKKEKKADWRRQLVEGISLQEAIVR